MKYSDLPSNHKFCVHPWFGVAIEPDGKFTTCCIQKEDLRSHQAKLTHSSIEQLRNSDFHNKLRSDLLHGIENPACNSCWNLERNGVKSLRESRLQEFEYFTPQILSTVDFNDDGSLDDSNQIFLWDVRQTNLCNMKCLMCGPALSSLWMDELIKHDVSFSDKTPVIDLTKLAKENIYDYVINNIPKDAMIYFAGGEPLISDFHWQILDYLVNAGRSDVRICYNTNLLKLDYKQKDAIKYWEKFESVYIGASIDCIGSRAEYVRYGTKWNRINENISKLANHPTIKHGLNLNVTTSALTFGGLADTIAWANTFEPLQHANRILLQNLVYSPERLSIKILPDELKEKIWEPLRPIMAQYGDGLVTSFETELFSSQDISGLDVLRATFKTHIDLADIRRNTDIRVACPELADWFETL